jgi:2-isopropylmalate synthase
VRIALEGRRYNGRGLSTDIVAASVKAYLAAINAAFSDQGVEAAPAPEPAAAGGP